MKSQSAKTPAAGRRKDPNRYPKGFNRGKVRAIVDHYDNQTEEAAVAEDAAAYRSNTITMMGVPVELVPAVQKLIARRSG